MKKYYLITEKCRDGDQEYYSYIPVSTTTPRDKWDANWENLFLCWQYTCDSIDSDGLWSDMRIVSIFEVKEINFDEHNTIGNLITDHFKLDEILEEGREAWVENELEKQQKQLKLNTSTRITTHQMKLLKITIKIPCDKGFRDEKQIITEDSTSHELLRNYANENMYEIISEPIEMTIDQLKNRLAHINSDIKIIEETIKRNVPILLNNESYSDTKVFAETFKQNITNIYTACDLTSDEVETEWSTHESILPTYAEYTKDMSLNDKFDFYYDLDITNLCEEMADALSSPPTWLNGFEKDFENYLKEREYIR